MKIQGFPSFEWFVEKAFRRACRAVPRARDPNPRISWRQDKLVAIFCDLCGADPALVGRAHRCIPRADANTIADDDNVARRRSQQA